MSDTVGLENEVLQAMTQLLDALRTRLQSDQLTVTLSPITREGQGASYESEIELILWRQGDVVNAISQFIYFRGQPVATAEQINAWLRSDVETALASNRA
jgi:hypothetical protein